MSKIRQGPYAPAEFRFDSLHGGLGEETEQSEAEIAGIRRDGREHAALPAETRLFVFRQLPDLYPERLAMRAIEEVQERNRKPRKPVTIFPVAESAAAESRTYCAYNRTRECFLGLEVTHADLACALVGERLKSLSLKSGEGLWIKPFDGMPAADVPAPLDLIYLDENDCVTEMVESFPTFRASASAAKPASVLALPAHSIYSSQTQPGDQLVLCVAEEMEARLAGQSPPERAPMMVRGAVLLREEPLWSGGPGIVELETPTEKEQRHEMNLAKPGARNPQALKNWLERWWSPDPRKAPREAHPGPAAYFWNGAVPGAHGIRDISSSGMYVVTEERWYPGTLVLMTQQRTDAGEEMAERSISVLSRAVRWGHDGVGLQFILTDQKNARKDNTPLMDSADKKELERFLQELKKRN